MKEEQRADENLRLHTTEEALESRMYENRWAPRNMALGLGAVGLGYGVEQMADGFEGAMLMFIIGAYTAGKNLPDTIKYFRARKEKARLYGEQ